jgi:hypothetical protein
MTNQYIHQAVGTSNRATSEYKTGALCTIQIVKRSPFMGRLCLSLCDQLLELETLEGFSLTRY